jgi:hypothetical protein
MPLSLDPSEGQFVPGGSGLGRRLPRLHARRLVGPLGKKGLPVFVENHVLHLRGDTREPRSLHDTIHIVQAGNALARAIFATEAWLVKVACCGLPVELQRELHRPRICGDVGDQAK